jgi:hypothetical protein
MITTKTPASLALAADVQACSQDGRPRGGGVTLCLHCPDGGCRGWQDQQTRRQQLRRAALRGCGSGSASWAGMITFRIDGIARAAARCRRRKRAFGAARSVIQMPGCEVPPGSVVREGQHSRGHTQQADLSWTDLMALSRAPARAGHDR